MEKRQRMEKGNEGKKTMKGKRQRREKDNKGKKDDRNARSSRSRSRSRSRSISGTRLQTPKYPRSQDNSSSREKSDHSNCLQFLLKEEIESDTSDSEENNSDTDEAEDKFYACRKSSSSPVNH